MAVGVAEVLAADELDGGAVAEVFGAGGVECWDGRDKEGDWMIVSIGPRDEREVRTYSLGD